MIQFHSAPRAFYLRYEPKYILAIPKPPIKKKAYKHYLGLLTTWLSKCCLLLLFFFFIKYMGISSWYLKKQTIIILHINIQLICYYALRFTTWKHAGE